MQDKSSALFIRNRMKDTVLFCSEAPDAEEDDWGHDYSQTCFRRKSRATQAFVAVHRGGYLFVGL